MDDLCSILNTAATLAAQADKMEDGDAKASIMGAVSTMLNLANVQLMPKAVEDEEE